MRGLYYFTNDQRISENPLLLQATEECESLCFVAKAPSSTWGHYRQKFHWESLTALAESLRAKGQLLNILADPLNETPFSLFDKVYVSKWNTHYEKKEHQLIPPEKKTSFFQDRLLDDSPDSLPDIYTEFRKKIEKTYSCPSPAKEPSFSHLKPSNVAFNTLEAPEFDGPGENSAFPFLGGEKEGLKRLESYTFQSQNILTYKKTRNGLLGTEYSTKLSPYLALGNLSPITIFRRVEQFEKEVRENQDTYWVKFELWWREYFRWVFEKYPNRFFSPQGIKNKEISYIENRKLFNSWVKGDTKSSFINAFMKEIKFTGFMSNRGRQIVASYLVNDLNLPWWWGADYFERVLIDYDVYSNWGNWQYVAGVGNDPRPNRYFNPEKQSKNYDPEGDFEKLWLSPSD